MVRKAVIPAAGLGTRFLPVTKVVPKELLPIGDQPSIHYIVEEVVEAGISEVIFVLSPFKKTVMEYFEPKTFIDSILAKHGKDERLEQLYDTVSHVKFSVALQQEAKGLGHAVACAEHLIGGEDFMVLLPDDIIYTKPAPSLSKQMMEVYQRFDKRGVVALNRVSKDELSSYGVAEGETIEPNVMALKRLVEKPSPQEAPSDLAVVGRYILPASIFAILKQGRAGKLGEVQLTDALSLLAAEGKLLGYMFEGRRFDIGVPQGLAIANLFFMRDDPDVKAAVKEFL